MSKANTAKKKNIENPAAFRKKMLDWYHVHKRVLPWRAPSGVTPDSYHVWLSEIMLQQTTVQAVIPYFLKFVKRWPTVHDLADADNDEVMTAWAGLGYYARARNLHKCAIVVSKELNGIFPDTQEELKKLPGIGDYTSAAITSIAFNKPAVVIDGNVDRVMARYGAIETPFPEGKKDVKVFAEYYAKGFTDQPSDYAQSLMDLGAGVCTPKSPLCSFCPINDNCMAFKNGQAEFYPKKSPKKERPHKYGYVYWIENEEGQILLEKRPDKGLLGGMMGLPTSEWIIDKEKLTHNAYKNIEVTDQKILHVFTHFSLELIICKGKGIYKDFEQKYYSIDHFSNRDFPTVFKKVFDTVVIPK